MTEVDEDVHLWVAAAVIPTDSDTEETDEMMRSPSSAVHIGASPPPPPPYPPPPLPATGALTPQTTLENAVASPIETVYEDFGFLMIYKHSY